MSALLGLKVIDFTHAISGPTCTNMLAQLGAEIVKIEPPGRGDGFRHYTEHGGAPLLSIPFAAINAGKQSLALDLKSAAGQRIARDLIATADVVVENFRPGVMARLGLAPDDLRAADPDLIVVSISGFGQDGPMAHYGAYDHIAQAASGIAAMNATADGPLKIGIPIIDSFTGYIAVIALLAALRTRDVGGGGAHLDIAMLDAALKLVNTSVAVHSATGTVPMGTGNRGFRLVATSEFYPTGNGWIALGANEQTQVAALFRVLGHAAMIDDPRFATHSARTAHYADLRAWLIETLAGFDAATLERDLVAAGVAAVRLRDVGEIAGDPHIRQRGTLEQVEVPGDERPLDVVAGFANAARVGARVPLLGEHGDAVLAALGLDPAAIAALRRDGVVA
ncbi:CaiB/BaiF CoA transferase family protein [Sphingomonas sp. BAUL-RG-20F-R05-02]|uniref:CaiB/BaiF CoA transferase family protein n=1 Tax=Sphingomonas sp. BAUL-RG-20F-R05-02 TaxID=2914830 RepID=UPI001F59E313|nr:CoA transferase [Sphingomonas sp. BAUL-RG-20F-R05-02]